jgi:O-antigen/teichoic acid export membrane protein
MIILATAPIFLVMALFSKAIITMIFGVDFQGATLSLIILAVGFFANTICGASGTLMQMMGRENLVFKVLLVTSALNIAGNLLLIPILGPAGAAISTGFTTFLYQLILRLKLNHDTGT